MSAQAEFCVQVLMLLYVEFDRRSGWVDREKLFKHFEKKGVGRGRTTDAIRTLKSLTMVEENDANATIKLSSYGIDWFEKTLPLISREPEYEFALPTFRSVKLVGPDTFYRRKSAAKLSEVSSVDWTKWGVIVAVIIGIFSIAITKGWI